MDNESLKEILETKLDSIKEELSKLDAKMEKQGDLTQAEREEMKAAIVRLHTRIDVLETRVNQAPLKRRVGETIKEKLIEMIPYAIVGTIGWFIVSGNLVALVKFLAGK